MHNLHHKEKNKFLLFSITNFIRVSLAAVGKGNYMWILLYCFAPCKQDYFPRIHSVIILNRGSMFAFQWREFSPPLSSAPQNPPIDKREIRDAAIPGGNAEYIRLPQPKTRAISQWARSLEWRHVVTLHILVWKIYISFFIFYCEGMLSLVVLSLCARIPYVVWKIKMCTHMNTLYRYEYSCAAICHVYVSIQVRLRGHERFILFQICCSFNWREDIKGLGRAAVFFFKITLKIRKTKQSLSF